MTPTPTPTPTPSVEWWVKASSGGIYPATRHGNPPLNGEQGTLLDRGRVR
jgi:hypothetical protein